MSRTIYDHTPYGPHRLRRPVRHSRNELDIDAQHVGALTASAKHSLAAECIELAPKLDGIHRLGLPIGAPTAISGVKLSPGNFATPRAPYASEQKVVHAS